MSRFAGKLALSGLFLAPLLLLAACSGSQPRGQETPLPAAAATPAPATTPAEAPVLTVEAPLTPAAAATAVAQATALATLAPAPTAPFPATPQAVVVQWEKNDKLGDILTDPQGRTVYTYKSDTPGQSVCTGDCAKTWPPVTLAKGWQPWGGPRVPGALGVITRPDGTSQVTYDGKPLYLYSGDTSAGDANGQGFANLWAVVQIAPATTVTPTARP